MTFPVSPEKCIFLVGGRCSVHAVKPQECRSAYHARRKSPKGEHAAVAKAWQGEAGRAIIRELGFDPDNLELATSLLDQLAFLAALLQ